MRVYQRDLAAVHVEAVVGRGEDEVVAKDELAFGAAELEEAQASLNGAIEHGGLLGERADRGAHDKHDLTGVHVGSERVGVRSERAAHGDGALDLAHVEEQDVRGFEVDGIVQVVHARDGRIDAHELGHVLERHDVATVAVQVEDVGIAPGDVQIGCGHARLPPALSLGNIALKLLVLVEPGDQVHVCAIELVKLVE